MKKAMICVVLVSGVAIPLCVLSQKAQSEDAQSQKKPNNPQQQAQRKEEKDAPVSGGVIRFSGMVSSPTCVINGGNGGENFEVNLPTVSASHFNAKGKTAGDTTFKITLTGCGEAGTKIRANFQKGVMVDSTSGRLNINRADTHSAQNIQIELASPATDAPVVIGTDQQTTTYFPVDKNGNVEMTYVARYYATGKVAPGHVNSQVTYVLQYQ